MARGFVASRDRAELERLVKAVGEQLSARQSGGSRTAEASGGEPPSDERLAALGRYLELVSTWNAKLDLTAARDTPSLLEVMLADALVLAGAELVPANSRCVDVGSGAGAPGLPLAVLRDDLTLVLVEPLRKRVAFLRTVVGSLQLTSRVRVLEQKIDPDAPALDEGELDLALSRATFAPEVWLPTGLALAPRTLVLLAAQPLPAAERATLEREEAYTLPFSRASRRIASYRRAC